MIIFDANKNLNSKTHNNYIIYLRHRFMFVNNSYVYKQVENRIAKAIQHNLGPDFGPDFVSQADFDPRSHIKPVGFLLI